MAQPGVESVLIHNAEYVVTGDETRPQEDRLLENASIGIVGNQIQQVGGDFNTNDYDQVLDATGHVIVPGTINGHHHLFQGFLRGYPAIQNKPIDQWINQVCRVARGMDDTMLRDAALLNMAELLRYGTTTTTDMSYVTFTRRNFLRPTMSAAEEIGIRFEAFTGGLSLSEKDDALFPDDAAQDSDRIATYIEDAILAYHDPGPYAMQRVGVGLCGIFTNTPQDFRNAVALRERFGIGLQTHVSESSWESDIYAKETFGERPVQVLRDLGWLGAKTSYVHCIYADGREITKMADDGTSAVNCPISNSRGSQGEVGIAPVYEMLQAGVNVALGVDGSAGNDSSNLREEARIARTIQGARAQGTYLQAGDTLRMATVNGAKMLGRENELGVLRPGMAADLAAFDLNNIEIAGTWDPVTALLATQALRASVVLVNGKVVIEGSQFTTFDERALLQRIRTHMQALRKKVE